MKRLFWIVLFCLSVSPLYANQSTSGWCEAGNRQVTTQGMSSATKVQQSFPQCTVSVYPYGASQIPANLATIYSDPSNTPLSNPFTANANGRWQFYAANGHYDVVLSGGGFPSALTISNVVVGPTTQACSDNAGANGGEKIAACIAMLASTGGTADASAIQGPQTISANMFAGITKPVDLLLCGATYTVTATQAVTNGGKVHIHGCEYASTTITFSGSASGFSFTNTSDVEIDHLNITGGVTPVYGGGGTARLNVHHVTFTGPLTSGTPTAFIYQEAVNDFRMSYNYFSGGASSSAQGNYTVVANYAQGLSSRCMADHNTIIGSNEPINLAFFDCSESIFDHNYVNNNNQFTNPPGNNSGYGLLSYSFTSANNNLKTVVNGNEIVNTAGSAIYLAGSDKITVTGNVLYDCAKQQDDTSLSVGCISVSNDTSASNYGDVTISGNEMTLSGKDGIVLGTTRNTTVSGNTARRITHAALRYRGTNYYTHVSGFTADTVQNCLFLDTTGNITGGTISLTCNASTQPGVQVANSTNSLVDVALGPMTFTNQSLNAIRVTGAVRTSLTGVVTDGCTGPCVQWTGDYFSMNGGTVSGSSTYGVEAIGNWAKITGVTITSSTLNPVHINGSDGIVQGCMCQGNGTSTLLFSDATSFGRDNRFTSGNMQGQATLVMGTVLITNTEYIDANTLIFITATTYFGMGATVGSLEATYIANGQFRINSRKSDGTTETGDTRLISYRLDH